MEERHALIDACQKDDTALVERLLWTTAFVNAKDKDGQTPLHHAASHGNTSIVKKLILHGADATTTDRFGRTPLHEATVKGHTECAKMILEHGVSQKIDCLSSDAVKVIVATLSPHKLKAVELSFEKYFRGKSVYILGIDGASMVSAQPVGHEETIRGAVNRLSNCKNNYLVKCAKDFSVVHDSLSQRQHPFAGMQPDYYVSIESGLFSTSLPVGYQQQELIWFDVAWVLIENNSTGRRQLSCSSAIQFPTAAVASAEKMGFQTTTAGKILSNTVAGVDHTDPQRHLTDERKCRKDQICEALFNALSQIHHEPGSSHGAS